MNTQDYKSLFDSLEGILLQMTQCTDMLDGIVQREREAVKIFDGETLRLLMDLRERCHKELAELETRCHQLLQQGGAPEAMNLETFIDLYGQDISPRFQSLRRKLYERMSRLNKDSDENRIRLHAAYDVTTNLLQHIGVIESKQTYGPREVR